MNGLRTLRSPIKSQRIHVPAVFIFVVTFMVEHLERIPTYMHNTVSIFLFGKKYEVPDNLTIMTAMEYVGYQLVHGCGCRNGFCGACATVYRIDGEGGLKTCLACQTQVEDNMYIVTPPSFPPAKQLYDIDKVKADESVMMQLYPEIYSCVGCNACTKACPKGLDVMQYIADAQKGDFGGCADKSFECVMCGLCSSKCPVGIPHAQVAMLARRINGKYLSFGCEHLEKRVNEIRNGAFKEIMDSLMQKPIEEIKELYNDRDIEK